MQTRLYVILCVASLAWQTARAETIAFAAATAGIPAPDFELWRTGDGEPGKWAVVREEGPGGHHVLEQFSSDKTSYRFPLAIYKPFSGKNVEVSVRFKAVAGSVDRAAGLAIRLTTPGDYYVVRANALENNVRFYRVVKGSREQLQSADVMVTSNEWHTLAIRAKDDMFAVSFNGKQLFTAEDKTFGWPGKVALWTKADSVTRFDQLEINGQDR